MADSLFDNRYRYDFIYPRGRSGETLRAVDTRGEDRPVVIKRPAPSDAPPIRAGQEVSILNERRALLRLVGHPALPELLGDGQFPAGGTTHQYIVMERAEGIIIADEVLRLASQGERLPELEALIIVDRLLDLLNSAHLRDIVYNDVDAKHLFWDRDHYRLKVIDWGNAVFLEGDEITPQGISRQSDIYQTGELLYFIVTGGRRAETPRDAGEDFRVDFGEDTENIPERLQTIISKALHPNPRLRYNYIGELRRDLADYRSPLERERDALLGRVAERLRRNLSKNELRALMTTLDSAMTSDPGNPAGLQIRREIDERLHDLEVTAGMDAVRIYMDGGQWRRAVGLLNELREKAGSQTATLVNLLLDFAVLMADAGFEQDTPPVVMDALNLIFDGSMVAAAQILLTDDTADNAVRRIQWLLAERISSHVPEALLLRPNLFRLELALATLASEGISLAEARTGLAEIRNLLDGIGATRNLATLRDAYRTAVDRLSALNTLLSTVAVQHNLSNHRLPLSSLDRALNAAMALADNMHVIGKQATGSPRDAMAALDSSRAIDPTNPAWEAVGQMLDTLYQLLQSYQTYVPSADGSDLEDWFKTTQSQMQPFLQSLFDELLIKMVDGVREAEKAWGDYAHVVLQGSREGAIGALTHAIDSVTTISPTLTAWLNQLRSVVEGSAYVERHSLYGGLGRALADGWEAFDRSRLPDAERLGQHAFEIARSEDERMAAQRLRDLSRITREWIDRNIILNVKRAQTTLSTVEALYTPDELKVRDNFNAQMPSKDTYLRAMNKGLVELFQRHSSAASRILSLNFIILGTLDTHDGLIDDGRFWREAALRAIGESKANHVLIRTFDDFIDRRVDLNRITGLLNSVQTESGLKELDKTRRLIEENPQAKLVAPAVLSLRELESGIREWADGEFRAAGLKLENALKAATEVQQSNDLPLDPYREWLAKLQSAAAELHVLLRTLRQEIEKRPTEPQEAIRSAHHKMTQITEQLLGSDYAATLVNWRDTYERFLAVYTDRSMRRSQKMERFNELFRAMFIDRHPAYVLYRHWFDQTERSPEFPAPPTDDPTPRIDENAVLAEEIYNPETVPSRYRETEAERPGSRRFSRLLILLMILGVIAAGAAFLILRGQSADGGTLFGGVAVTLSETPTPQSATDAATDASGVLVASGTEDVTPSPTPRTAVTATPRPATATPDVSDTPEITEEAVIVPSQTEPPAPSATPTETFTPSITPTSTETPTPTSTSTPTLPPEGLQGTQDLLARLSTLPESEITWTAAQFSPETRDEYWRFSGVGDTGSEEVTVGLSGATLNGLYGNNAATRIRRAEAVMTLLTLNPEIPTEQIYFGMVLRAADGSEVGIYVQAQSLNTVNIYQRVNGQTTFVVQQAVNVVRANIRLDRDPNTGAVTTYLNNNPIGQPVILGGANAPVLPTLFVHDGGLVIGVTDWNISLQ
jgi:hypothetical protein